MYDYCVFLICFLSAKNQLAVCLLHEMYGIHDDEILDDHKVFDRYEHHVIEAQEPVSPDGDTEMDLSAAQDVMDALEDLLLEIPAVELTARASQFHDDFDAALNDLLTI